VKICVAHPKRGSVEHRACHNAARRYIRGVIRNPQHYAMYRVIELRQRVDHASRAREELRRRIAKLDRRIAAAEAELESYYTVGI
jgi:hypothetical protein